MGGTIVCGVTDAPGGQTAAELATALGARLGVRVVLVQALDGVPPDAHDSLSTRQRQTGAERALAALAHQAGGEIETRVVVGERADVLAQIAAEEGADLIVVGSRAAGLGSRNLRCALARELEAATPVPVLVAPPATRRRSDHRLEVAAATTAR